MWAVLLYSEPNGYVIVSDAIVWGSVVIVAMLSLKVWGDRIGRLWHRHFTVDGARLARRLREIEAR